MLGAVKEAVIGAVESLLCGTWDFFRGKLEGVVVQSFWAQAALLESVGAQSLLCGTWYLLYHRAVGGSGAAVKFCQMLLQAASAGGRQPYSLMVKFASQPINPKPYLESKGISIKRLMISISCVLGLFERTWVVLVEPDPTRRLEIPSGASGLWLKTWVGGSRNLGIPPPTAL